jgi:hypothetical protein
MPRAIKRKVKPTGTKQVGFSILFILHHLRPIDPNLLLVGYDLDVVLGNCPGVLGKWTRSGSDADGLSIPVAYFDHLDVIFLAAVLAWTGRIKGLAALTISRILVLLDLQVIPGDGSEVVVERPDANTNSNGLRIIVSDLNGIEVSIYTVRELESCVPRLKYSVTENVDSTGSRGCTVRHSWYYKSRHGQHK